ncbi:N-acetyltransferase [Arthrobacter pityocampae]|uniref:N-acetyltransferase n=1 Tax=Arthrobacter pityocampae TaxID=547334 RepID=A0A2S5J299_9MICC|nr:GNAT family N-acetyltransferase [Arthrobacter pityocampae]PPB50956.1 N-acetyltransferase [Arthrobacter pityocampae]
MRITAGAPPLDRAIALYDAVGWTAYTRDPDRLARSLAGSHLVVTAWDDDGGLRGLARTVSDGESICYIQDLLVHPASRRRGVARALLEDIQGRYGHCMFLALSTDAEGTEDAALSHPFYRALGFQPHAELRLAAFGYRP